MRVTADRKQVLVSTNQVSAAEPLDGFHPCATSPRVVFAFALGRTAVASLEVTTLQAVATAA